MTQEDHTKPLLLFNPDAETPKRPQQLANLSTGTKDYPFDVLIIGGGATGSGIAVDAATRSGGEGNQMFRARESCESQQA